MADNPDSFASLLGLLMPKGAELGGPEPLAGLAYGEELQLKQEALENFWKKKRLPGKPGIIVPSPLPRGYRSTSKRRVFHHRGRPLLLHPGERPGPVNPVSLSVLEPKEHQDIFLFLQERLCLKADALGQALNWVIARNTLGGLSVIFNVFRLDSSVVRKAKLESEMLLATVPRVISVFLFHDPTRSAYYLEAGEADLYTFGQETRGSLKRLAGPRCLGINVDGLLLRFSPLVFSQINASMLPVLIDTSRDLLETKGEDVSFARLIDLYCGYGLFSFCLGRAYSAVSGLELSGVAFEAARENYANMRRKGVPGLPAMNFLQGRINARTIGMVFKDDRIRPVHLILDPPRKGPEPGVIETAALFNPRKVLHLFCGTDEIPAGIKRWKEAGYHAVRMRVLDMFPGTANLETAVLLERRDVLRERRV